MKRHLVIAAAATLLLGSFNAQAAEQSVALTVHHADCALCVPIVKGALERVKVSRALPYRNQTRWRM